MIVLVGFLLAPLVLWLGLKIYPDLTTFFLYGLVPGGLLFGGLAYAVSNLGLSLPVGALVGGLVGLGLLASLGLYRRRVTHTWQHIGDGQAAFEKRQRQEQATHDKTWRLIYPDYQPDHSRLPRAWIPTPADEAGAHVDFDLMKRFQAAWDEQHPEDAFDNWKPE